MGTPLRLAVLFVALGVVSACGNYEGMFRYVPSPAQVLLEDDGEVLAAVEGLRLTGEGNDERYVFDVRLRFDHRSASTAWTFDPQTATLTTGGLQRLEHVIDGSVASLNIAPQSAVDAELVFALPPGAGPDDVDLSGLHLTLRLERAGGPGTVSAGFERRVAVSRAHDHWPYWTYGPYWHDPWYRSDVYYVVPARGRRGRRRR